MTEREMGMMGSGRLELVVQRVSIALDSEANGDLVRGLRESVWNALGPLDRLGRERRAHLAIASASRVIPAWEQARPGDERPHKLLQLAEGILEGTVDLQIARTQYDRAIVEMDDASNVAEDQIPISAGYAAAQALMAAIEDEAFDPSSINFHRTDNESDPDERDAGYFAAVVASGGPPWDPSSDPEARRSFWRWWLAEALRISQTEDG